MINRLHVFKNIPKLQEFPNVAKLGIHLGLSLHKDSESRQVEERWTKLDRASESIQGETSWTLCRAPVSSQREGRWTQYILQILDDVKPYLVHIHHNGGDDSLPVGTVNALKAEQHVVQRQPGGWKIWSR